MDLFLSKKEQLRLWIARYKIVRTSAIAAWGVENYCNDSIRLARKLAEEGHIRRLTKQEIVLKGIKTKEGMYETVKTNVECFA